MSETSPNQFVPEQLQNVTGYINAGGRGTRLAGVLPSDPNTGIAKAMLELGVPPIKLIDHHVNKLIDAGIGNVIVGAGDQNEVASYVNHTYVGRPEVQVVSSEERFGTGGDLVSAVRKYPEVFKDTIVIANADTIMDIDEASMVELHRNKNAEFTIAVTRRRNVHNQDGYYVDYDDRAIYCDESPENDRTPSEAEAETAYRASSIGTVVLSKEALSTIDWIPKKGELSIYTDILAHVLKRRSVYAYDNGLKYIQDIGTEDAWHEAKESPSTLQPHLHYDHQV